MRIEQVDYETRYHLVKHTEDPDIDIERILNEHERMRRTLEIIGCLSGQHTAFRAVDMANDVLEGRR